MKHLKNFKQNAMYAVYIYALLLTVVVISAPSCSNKNKPEDTKDVVENNNADEKKDEQFLVDAAQINLEEIKLGQLAQQNSTMPEVREMGKMMEIDHTKCLSDLKALADKKSILIPTSTTKESEEIYEKLVNLSGAEFDKKNCAMMVDGHKNAISEFEKAIANSNDPDIRAWASETLPALRKHLDHVLNCQKNCSKM